MVHHYLETLDGILLDPTWQQFLDPDISSNDLPKVMVTRRETLEQTLIKLGIRPINFAIWLNLQDLDASTDEQSDEWGWSRPQDESSDEEWGRWGWGDGRDDPLPVIERPVYPRAPTSYEIPATSISARSIGNAISAGTSSLEYEVRPTLTSAIDYYNSASEKLVQTLAECRTRIAELARVDHSLDNETVNEAEAEIIAIRALMTTIQEHLDNIERQRGRIELAHYAIGCAIDDISSYRRLVQF